MTVTGQLYHLQEIDAEIESGEQSLSQKTRQLGDRGILDNAQSELDAKQQQLAELSRQHHDAEWELDDLLSKIAAVEKQLYGGKVTNPKELSNLQHEAGTMKAKSDQMETRALKIIDLVEAAEKSAAAATSELKEMGDEWQRQQQQLAGEIAHLKSSLADLKQKRQQLSNEIESQAVALYEKIRQNKQPPVARVEQGICRACRISLSASALQRARSGQPVQCDSCGRILFIP